MPCNSEYMRQNDYEKRLQETAQLLVFAMRKLGQTPRPVMVDTAENQYARNDFTADLCKLINGLNEFDADRIVYNGRDPMSRRLADWWDRHQQADKKRTGALDEAIAAVEKTITYESITQGFKTVIKYRGVDAARGLMNQSGQSGKKLVDVAAGDYVRLAHNLLILLRVIRTEETI